MARRVVLVCGPPGAGKSTYAHTLGLQVFDRDDPEWRERDFVHAISRLRLDPEARAVVLRAGASVRARAEAADLIGATETVLMLTPREECVRRIRQRRRTVPPIRTQLGALADWWRRYEPDDGPSPRGTTSRDW